MTAHTAIRLAIGAIALAVLVAAEVLGWPLSSMLTASLGAVAGWVVRFPGETKAAA